MDIAIDILALLVEIIALYTAAIGALFLLPMKKQADASAVTRFAILIPARNEENVISSIVESLLRQHYPKTLYDIYVIPNNCTDSTADAALAAGAQILSCTAPVRNKGDVLHQAFAQLMGSYDAYCVFDADNIVDSEFLSAMNSAIVAGAQVAKCCQIAANPYDSWVSGCYDIYIANYNLLYNRPRRRLGLSARLVGTGFMVTDTLMQRLGGWNTTSITEDAEFAAQCALLNVPVRYVPEAVTYDEQPVSFHVSMRQRRRWSAGVQYTANGYTLRLLSRPSWLRFDVAVYLTGIYCSLLALIPSCVHLLQLPLPAAAQTLLFSIGTFWLGSTGTALLLSLLSRRQIRKMWKSIFLYPFFAISWYVLHFFSLFVKPKQWTPIPHQSRVYAEKR